MSVQRTRMAVTSFVQTQLDHTCVSAALDTGCLWMAGLVQVRKVFSSTITVMWMLKSWYIDIDECAENSDGCAQLCTNTVGNYTCSCRSGYRLASDGHWCAGIFEATLKQCNYILNFSLDVNECVEETDTCQRLCINTMGSYSCDCITGYRLALDGSSCRGVCVKMCCNESEFKLTLHMHIIIVKCTLTCRYWWMWWRHWWLCTKLLKHRRKFCVFL